MFVSQYTVSDPSAPTPLVKADSKETKLTAYEVDCVRDGHKCCDPRRLRKRRVHNFLRRHDTIYA